MLDADYLKVNMNDDSPVNENKIKSCNMRKNLVISSKCALLASLNFNQLMCSNVGLLEFIYSLYLKLSILQSGIKARP